MTTNIQTASMRNCIQLAACSATQLLPMNPELPADLFTACLTTPIKMALRWFVMQNQGKLAPRITVEMLDKIPGMIYLFIETKLFLNKYYQMYDLLGTYV